MISNDISDNATIRNILIDAGYDSVGFASAFPTDNWHNKFTHWLDSGMHADMLWMERNIEKRLDLHLIIAEAKSVIVCLMNYNVQNAGYDSKTGKISRYAWGDDYHDVANEKLKQAVDKLKTTFPDNEFKYYTDTGPVLEKLWAWRAGLGWLGRNSLLINRNLGSWCFISVIITDLTLKPDQQSKDYCGSCRACIEACPTSAILSDKTVDSRKCISYWTIESKNADSFPDDITKNLNGWLFGCDICEEVCPWNRKTPLTQKSNFKPRNNETGLSDEMIENLDDETFRLRFKNSPIKRRKLSGLKTNLRELKRL